MTSQLQFNYLYNQTEIVDLSNRKLTYQFDTFGRPTCIYDSEGNSYVETILNTAIRKTVFLLTTN